jgi:entericidin B
VLLYEIFAPNRSPTPEQSPHGRVCPLTEEDGMIRILTALCLISALAACETMEGLGRDVQAGGEAIQQSAEEVQDGL